MKSQSNIIILCFKRNAALACSVNRLWDGLSLTFMRIGDTGATTTFYVVRTLEGIENFLSLTAILVASNVMGR